MTLEEKRAQDERTLELYKRQLEYRRKEYSQEAKAFSQTGRRSRALALGECALKCMDAVRDLNRKKTLIEGTLFYGIREQRVRDDDGRKGFEYCVYYRVKSDEPYYTEEEIEAEVAETRRRVEAETAEMFADVEEDQEDDREDREAIPAEEAAETP